MLANSIQELAALVSYSVGAVDDSIDLKTLRGVDQVILWVCGRRKNVGRVKAFSWELKDWMNLVGRISRVTRGIDLENPRPQFRLDPFVQSHVNPYRKTDIG
jgi:hypothetical protein